MYGSATLSFKSIASKYLSCSFLSLSHGSTQSAVACWQLEKATREIFWGVDPTFSMDNNESYTIFYEFYIENSSVNLSNLMEVSQITRKTPIFTFFF